MSERRHITLLPPGSNQNYPHDDYPEGITETELVEYIRSNTGLKVHTNSLRTYKSESINEATRLVDNDQSFADVLPNDREATINDLAKDMYQKEKAKKAQAIISDGFRSSREAKDVRHEVPSDLIFQEIDHFDGNLDTVKMMVCELPYVVLCYTSTGGDGIHVFSRLSDRHPRMVSRLSNYKDNVKEFHRRWRYVQNQLNQDLEGIIDPLVWDKKVRAAARLSFIAHDPDVYYNPNAIGLEVPEIEDDDENEDNSPTIDTTGRFEVLPEWETGDLLGMLLDGMNLEYRFNELTALDEIRPLENAGDWYLESEAWRKNKDGWMILTSSLQVKLRYAIIASTYTLDRRNRPRRFELPTGFFVELLKEHIEDNYQNPFRDYLQSLSWKDAATNDCDDLLFNIFQPELNSENEKEREVAKWGARALLVAAVARTINPGFPSQTNLLLTGKGGIGKSTVIPELLPDQDYFTDSLELDQNSAEKVNQTLGKVIVEVPEMQGGNRGDRNKMKSYLSKRSDRVRLPYEAKSQDYPRRFVLYITTNDHSPLMNDGADLRRYIPIRLHGSENSQREQVEEARNYLRNNRDRIWAAALKIWYEGDDENKPESFGLVYPKKDSKVLRRERERVKYTNEAIYEYAMEALVKIQGQLAPTGNKWYSVLDLMAETSVLDHKLPKATEGEVMNKKEKFRQLDGTQSINREKNAFTEAILELLPDAEYRKQGRDKRFKFSISKSMIDENLGRDVIEEVNDMLVKSKDWDDMTEEERMDLINA